MIFLKNFIGQIFTFYKFTGVQKGQKLGLDRLFLNFETLMWIFEWHVIKYEICRRKIRIKNASKWQKCNFAHYVFLTYHSKFHIKVSKFKNKLSRPNFRPFWTPVNFLKLMKPDLYNFFESSFWTPRWCSFLVYMPFSWRNLFINRWYLVGVISLIGYCWTYPPTHPPLPTTHP